MPLNLIKSADQHVKLWDTMKINNYCGTFLSMLGFIAYQHLLE